MTETVRRHVAVHFEGAVADVLDEVRQRWDPVMAARTPPHVTVVYPEETADEAVLADRLAHVATRFASFPVRFGGIETIDGGRGGVMVAVKDPSGALTAVRDELLLPPQRYLDVPFHTTLVHPRTSSLGEACADAVAGVQFDGEAIVDELLFTETGPGGRTVLSRHPLTGAASAHLLRHVGGVLVDGGRVLLGHRHPGRAYFPDVWDVVGGHVEPGESPRAALRRELDEELGIDAQLDGPWRHVVDDDLGVELTLWIVRRWTGRITNRDPDEHDELRWFDASQIGTLEFPHPAYPGLLLAALDADDM